MSVRHYRTGNSMRDEEIIAKASAALREYDPKMRFKILREPDHRHSYIVEWEHGDRHDHPEKFVRRWARSLGFRTSWNFKNVGNGPTWATPSSAFKWAKQKGKR